MKGKSTRPGTNAAWCEPCVVRAPGLTMLNTAMVSMMTVVMTVREMRGQGRFAMMPEDFQSHRREAEAFLLHCWEERGRKRNAYGSVCSRKVINDGD